MSSNGNSVDRDTALSQLERVLASPAFRQAERSAALLRYLAERSLHSSADRVKEYTVGVEALGRGTEFDPRTDPIVRAEASRVRGRLERYYANEGQADAVVIELPKGTYSVRFHDRPSADLTPADLVALGPKRDGRRLILQITLGTAAILAAFAGGIWTARSTPVAPTSQHVDVLLQSDEQIASDVGTDVVISPDGSRAVWGSIDSLGVMHLRVRRLDDTTAVIDLPGTVGGRAPFWSPDSRSIGFWADRQLRRISVEGGLPTVLRNAVDLLGASWGNDGTIIFSDVTGQLVRIDASNGETIATVVNLSADSAAARWPQILPGGRHVLYAAITGAGVGKGVDQAKIEVASLVDGKRRVVLEGGTFARFVAPGHLVFVNQGTLYAVRFDPSSLEVRGEKSPILEGVSYDATFGFAQFSVSDNGIVLYRKALPLVVSLLDSAGQRKPLIDKPGLYAWPSLSPDGQNLAVVAVESGVTGLHVFANVRERARLAWKEPGLQNAVWTHDGQFLVSRGLRGVAWLPASGGKPRYLIENGLVSVPWTFGPGDRSLSLAVVDPVTMFDLWTVPIEKTDSLRAGNATPILRRTDAIETYPAISPDGRWLAYSSNESGPSELYVRSLADTNIKLPIATGAGVPRWSRNGRRLFYTARHLGLMAVDYSVAGRNFVAGKPRRWTPTCLADTGVLPNYDLSDDDRHIVALLPARQEECQTRHVAMITGFSEELRRKLP